MKFWQNITSSLTLISLFTGVTLSFLETVAQSVPEPRSVMAHDNTATAPHLKSQETSFSNFTLQSVSDKLAQTSPESSEELGQQLMAELSQCMMNAIPNGEPQTLAGIQAASMECTVRVIILSPDGTVRSDANERMKALLTVTGAAIPPSVSQGTATVKLQTIPNSQVYTVPVNVAGNSEQFLLDTGASNSILSKTLIRQLGLLGSPIPDDIFSYFVVGDDCSNINATLHSIPQLTVDDATVQGMNGMGLPQGAIPGNSAGVLGLDFFKGFDMIINPTTATLELLPASEPVADAVPLQGKLGVMTASVYINGQGPFTFLLDTGADVVVISQRLAQNLSLDISEAEETEVQGFCGKEMGKKVQITSVKLETYESQNLTGVILDNQLLDLLGVDGIVGQNYLNQYQQHWRFGQPNELGFPETGSLTLKRL